MLKKPPSQKSGQTRTCHPVAAFTLQLEVCQSGSLESRLIDNPALYGGVPKGGAGQKPSKRKACPARCQDFSAISFGCPINAQSRSRRNRGLHQSYGQRYSYHDAGVDPERSPQSTRSGFQCFAVVPGTSAIKPIHSPFSEKLSLLLRHQMGYPDTTMNCIRQITSDRRARSRFRKVRQAFVNISGETRESPLSESFTCT